MNWENVIDREQHSEKLCLYIKYNIKILIDYVIVIRFEITCDFILHKIVVGIVPISM